MALLSKTIKCKCGCEFDTATNWVDNFEYMQWQCPKCGTYYVQSESKPIYEEDENANKVS